MANLCLGVQLYGRSWFLILNRFDFNSSRTPAQLRREHGRIKVRDCCFYILGQILLFNINDVPHYCSEHIIAIHLKIRRRWLPETHLISKDFTNIIKRKAGRHCLTFGFTIDL